MNEIESAQSLNHTLKLLTTTRRFEHPDVIKDRTNNIMDLLRQSKNTAVGKEFTWRRLKLLMTQVRSGMRINRAERDLAAIITPNVFTLSGVQIVEPQIYRRVASTILRLTTKRGYILTTDSDILGIDLEGWDKNQLMDNLRVWPNQYYDQFKTSII